MTLSLRGLTVCRNCAYPSGATYTELRVDGWRVGSFDVKDDGFLPGGCRKTLATEAEAIKSVVTRKVKSLRAEADRIEAAYNESLDAPPLSRNPTND